MRSCLCAALLLGLSGPSGYAVAQPASEEPSLPSSAELVAFLANPTTTAADAYSLGVQLFEAKRYEAAEQAWLRAFDLGRDPTLPVSYTHLRAHETGSGISYAVFCL